MAKDKNGALRVFGGKAFLLPKIKRNKDRMNAIRIMGEHSLNRFIAQNIQDNFKIDLIENPDPKEYGDVPEGVDMKDVFVHQLDVTIMATEDYDKLKAKLRRANAKIRKINPRQA